MYILVLDMALSVESCVMNILSLRGKAPVNLPEDHVRAITSVRNKCLMAEVAEGDAPLKWRSRGPPANNDRNSNRWRSSGAGNGLASSSSNFVNTKTVTKPVVSQSGGRYVSKFKNQESAVEDKILNQVILNKLNKFSATNYDEIKSFLQQILDSDEKEFLQSFMLLVFKKAATEPTYCPLYARMISELSTQYKTLYSELITLYTTYLKIFEEISENESTSYDGILQRTSEKNHRLGYSQFLAELTSLGVLEQEQLEKLYVTIINQIRLYAVDGEEKQQLIDEYVDCLLRMTRAFKGNKKPKLIQIRQGLSNTCQESISDILSKRTTLFPGLTKKSMFGLMDCLDIFRGSQ